MSSKNEMLLASRAFEAYCSKTGLTGDDLGQTLQEFFLSNQTARDGWLAAVRAIKIELAIPLEGYCQLNAIHMCQHSHGS